MNALDGIQVLVTRPAHQADGLCAAIEAGGGTAVRFPTIAILPPTDTGNAKALLDRSDWDRVIAVSANAVQSALDFGSKWHTCPLAAVGKATANALGNAGIEDVLTPEDGFNSEALLALPELGEVAGKRILIIHGEGGRDALANTLGERGAIIEQAEVYRRAIPDGDSSPLIERWRNGGIDVTTVTSNESLANLATMLGDEGRPLLQSTPLVGVSTRVLQLAASLGITAPPVIANSAHDGDVLNALLAWRRSRTDT